MKCAPLRSVWPVAPATLALLLASAKAPAAVHLLSAGQAFSSVRVTSTDEPTVTPDGQYVVYIQNAEIALSFELWSAPLAGGAPIRISRSLPPNGHVSSYRLSPDGSTVAYVENQPGVSTLLVTAVDGSTLPDELIGAPHSINSYDFSPDGTRVVWISDQQVSERYDLYSESLVTGGQVKESGFLVPGGDVTHFAISPNGAYLVYRADQAEDERFNLYGALMGGVGGDNWPISVPGFPTSDVGLSFAITPLNWVVYIQDLLVDEKFELRSTPIETQGAYQLNANLASNRDVLAFGISPDGTRAVYLADQDVDEQFELYSVPVDDAGLVGNVRKLNGAMVAGGDVWRDFVIGPNFVTFVADQDVDDRYELYSTSILGTSWPEGGWGPIRLHSELPPLSDVNFDPLLSLATFRVVFRVTHGSGLGSVELLSAYYAGGAGATLSPVAPSGTWVVPRAHLAGDGAHVFFERQSFPEPPGTSTTTLYRVPIGGGELLPAGPVLDFDGGERFWWTAPAVDPRQVVFVANPGTGAETELYVGDICVFCDGFESGETVRWSAAVR